MYIYLEVYKEVYIYLEMYKEVYIHLETTFITIYKHV